MKKIKVTAKSKKDLKLAKTAERIFNEVMKSTVCVLYDPLKEDLYALPMLETSIRLYQESLILGESYSEFVGVI